MIELSVHILTYNSEKHIEETLLSVLKQEVNFKYEIVIGDDCSTDNTLKIVQKYSKTHPHIFKVKKNKKQLGILGNFKSTLDNCIGKYVFDLAGDDLFRTKHALQKMVDILKSDDTLSFIDTGSDKLYDNNNSLQTFFNKQTLTLSKTKYLEKLILGKAASIGVCFNKKYLYQFVDFDYYINLGITVEDYPIIIDLAMNTNFKILPESLNIYRIHSNSASQKKTFKNHYVLKKQMKQLFDLFSIKYNFNTSLVKTFNEEHYKELLFLSGYFQKKQLGLENFKKIQKKSMRDYIHFFASQNTLLRKFISKI